MLLVKKCNFATYILCFLRGQERALNILIEKKIMRWLFGLKSCDSVLERFRLTLPLREVEFEYFLSDVLTNICFFFKPTSFQEKSFIVSCESVCPDVCCRRSEDTGRKVTFSTWNRREIVPWWRLGGSKSCESSLFLVIQKKIWLNNELQTTPLLGVLTYFLGYEPSLLLSLCVFLLTSKFL